MYELFYGLAEKPFALTPDPDFLYLSSRHRSALNLLEYAVTEQAGFVIITGEIGSGKTILIRHFLRSLDSDVTIGVISNTHRDFGNLMRWIHSAFRLEYKKKNKVQLYENFLEFLVNEHYEGRKVVLFVDEAQNLGIKELEELRTLSNVNVDKHQLLQIALVGQPELLECLHKHELRQFAQRIAADYELLPLTLDQTCSYIRHRLKKAGGSQDLFDDMACRAVFFFTAGVPRLINILCDTALVCGFSEDKDHIDYETIFTVVSQKGESHVSKFAEIARSFNPEEVARKIMNMKHPKENDPDESDLAKKDRLRIKDLQLEN